MLKKQEQEAILQVKIRFLRINTDRSDMPLGTARNIVASVLNICEAIIGREDWIFDENLYRNYIIR